MAEEEVVKEEAKPEIESAVETTKAIEESPAIVEDKEPVAEVNVNI